MSQLHDLTACEQAELIRRRELSSVELVDHYLHRIRRHGARLGAFISVFEEQALTEAAESDATSAQNRPLHGVPTAFKDLHPAAGMPTSFGSSALHEVITAEDSAAIANLRRHGVITMGKTNTCEFGPACYTDSQVGGVAVTPWDENHSASGSSGGAASAVAAGLLPFAHGSDGLGSIRTPAANCGLVGFKPSRGAVAGSGADFMSLAVEGPLARTVADTKLLVSAMGPGDAAAVWTTAPAPDDVRPVRLRIGVLQDPGIGGPIHPACTRAVDLAARALSDLGHEVEPLGALPTPARLDTLIGPLLTCIRTSLRLTVNELLGGRRDGLMPYTRWLLEGPSFTAEELLAAQRALSGAAAAHARTWAAYDVLLTPTTTAPPAGRDELRADDAEDSVNRMLRWSAFTPWANLSGHPAISLPVHQTSAGLPVAVQLVGRRGHDRRLLDIAGDLELLFSWHLAHPRVWSE